MVAVIVVTAMSPKKTLAPQPQSWSQAIALIWFFGCAVFPYLVSLLDSAVALQQLDIYSI